MSSKQWTKILCVALCLVMAVSLVGCKKTPSATGTATATPTTASSTGAAVTNVPTATPVPTVKPVDMGGRTFNFVTYMSNQKSNVAVTEGTDPQAVQYRERIKRIEHDYNCKVKFLGITTYNNWTQWDKVLQSSLANSPYADIAYVGPEYVYRGVSVGGAFQTLDKYKDILDLDNSNLWQTTVDKKIFTYNDMSLAVVARPIGTEVVKSGFVYYFNKSMLIKNGLWSKYNLYNMQANKTWNWKTLADISHQVAKDTNNDGQIDQFGFNYAEEVLRTLMHSNEAVRGTGGWVNVQANGTLLCSLGEKSNKQALEYIANLFQKKDITSYDKPSAGRSEGSFDLFVAGKTAFYCDYGQRLFRLKGAKMADTYGVVATPLSTNPGAQKDYLLPSNNPLPFVMSKGVKNPTQVAHMMRALIPPETTSQEEEMLMSQSLMSDYIGSEGGIFDTYKMLSEPERNDPDFDVIALGGVAIQMWIFMYNVGTVVEGTITSEQLISMTMPKFQTYVNDWWGTVQNGAKKMKKNNM